MIPLTPLRRLCGHPARLYDRSHAPRRLYDRRRQRRSAHDAPERTSHQPFTVPATGAAPALVRGSSVQDGKAHAWTSKFLKEAVPSQSKLAPSFAQPPLSRPVQAFAFFLCALLSVRSSRYLVTAFRRLFRTTVYTTTVHAPTARATTQRPRHDDNVTTGNTSRHDAPDDGTATACAPAMMQRRGPRAARGARDRSH